MNQSKVNICFTKNHYGESHLIGKVFEAKACKTFVLTDYGKEYLDYFEEGKNIVTFKNKKELLDKIKYYLENEKEREKIAEASYNRVVRNFSIDADLKNFFKKVEKENKKFKHRPLPPLNKRVIILSEEHLKLNVERLKAKVKDYDFITFKTKNSKHLKFKNYLQTYALVKTKKQISRCDYYAPTRYTG